MKGRGHVPQSQRYAVEERRVTADEVAVYGRALTGSELSD